MKKINAFTIVELLVAMVLSASIVLFGYLVYTKLNFRFNRAINQYGKVRELMQLQSLLNHDCSKALLAFYLDDKLRLESYDHRSVYYLFSDSRIVRVEKLNADTFDVGELERSAFYLFDNPPMLEKLILEVDADNLPYTLSININYSNKVKLIQFQLVDLNK